MFETLLPILAVSGFARTLNQADTTLHDLLGTPIDADARFAEAFQNKVRRASRYVKFSNLAALECLKKVAPTLLTGKKIGLFLGTGLGNTPDAVKFTSEVLQHYSTVVSPSTFINTVSNAGLFYAARALEMECITNVISQESISFEAALLSAQVMLSTGELDFALVGGVDVIEPPYEVSKERVHSKNVTAKSLGEGAAYLLLAQQECSHHPSLGQVKNVEVGVNPLPITIETSSDYKIALGMEHPERQDSSYYPYRHLCGDYPTGSAFALCHFIATAQKNSTLLHFSQHEEGAFARFLVSV